MKLAKSIAQSQQIIALPNDIKPGYVNENTGKYDYRQVVKDSRQFYHVDPIAGTVINRLCEISITDIRNRRKNKNAKAPLDDITIAYYNAVAQKLKPFLRQMALEYVLNGIVIPEYTTKRAMGNRATDKLGRTRYYFPDSMWCRNVDNIEIIKLPTGAKRVLFLKIPDDEVRLIKEKGGKDPAKKVLYQYYADNHAEYVAAIQRGERKFQLDYVYPLYRKLTSYNTDPIPYLTNALDALKHKARLKAMDLSIASRVIEAVRQIKVGNDQFPAYDDDIKEEYQSFLQYASQGERIFNYFTNHAVEITWSYPPFEALLSDTKYVESNREIFFALGFPRLWVSGETEKSNSSDNRLAVIGPLATIEDIRDSILQWITWFYGQLAEANGFDRIPEPYFTAINTSDVAQLIQYAADMYSIKAISKETIAELYNRVWEDEESQIQAEEAIAPENDISAQEPKPTDTNRTGVQQKDTTSSRDITNL